MSTVQDNPFLKQVDVIWDSWLSNVKTAQSFQDDVQEKALQAFTYQKELLDQSVKSISALEEEAKKAATQWGETLKSTVKDVPYLPEEQLSKWVTTVQDVTETVSALSWKPSTVLLEVFIKSQKQLEENVEKFMELQKTERTESIKKMEELVEQVKASQKELLGYAKPLTEVI